jgi:hypothetical protein
MIEVYLQGPRQDLAEVASYHAPTRPSGQLVEASLRIKARPFLVPIRQIGWKAGILFPNSETFDLGNTLLMDNPRPELEHDRVYNVFLLVLWYAESWGSQPESIGALVLEPYGAGEEWFRRIGFATPYFISSELIADRTCWIETVLRMHDEAELRVIEIM